MIRKENQKIDSLLKRFYQDEAKSMEIPDSGRCWQDFQQLLEQGEQERAGIPIPSTRLQKKDSFYHFISRYRNLTAVAAACILVVMLLGGMPPVQTLRQVLTGSLPQMESDSAKLMGLEDTAEEEQLLTEHKILSGEPGGRGGEPMAEDNGAESFGIMQFEAVETDQLTDDETLRQQSSPPGAGEMERFLPQDLSPSDVRELSFNTLEHYHSSLQENRELAPGKLFYLAVPPEGYRFHQGIISKTNTSLSGLRQEFINPEGAKLIVQQSFIVDIITTDELTEEKSETYSYGEPDYYFMQNGTNIMQWLREDSMITINAPLYEDDLLAIYNHLVALD